MSVPALRIEYISWGGHAKDARHKWCATFNKTGEVWDWGNKPEGLMRQAEKAGLSYELWRGRLGKRTVVKSWP